MTYIVITFAVLLFLNIYTSKTNQSFFYSNKEAWMSERCNLASSEISQLQVMNRTTISETLSPHQTLLLAIYWLFSGHLLVIF